MSHRNRVNAAFLRPPNPLTILVESKGESQKGNNVYFLFVERRPSSLLRSWPVCQTSDSSGHQTAELVEKPSVR